ncbi:(2Fe-2S) ferredoxin domain-containing protein [Algiphilus sp.]|uniref:(2Fe-2S) ferredoxin domain-containing protein n=1 Tax=Algiphilus sp. TaxID=1872431 RepID=UPI003C36F506
MADIPTPYYRHHLFFCCNRREAGAARPCCAARGAERVRAYAKERIKALGRNGMGDVRINMAGCLDRCEQGPVLVVYPEGVWYRYLDEDDIDDIIHEHIENGRIVERLRIPG